jgi:hypothetical protein
MIRLFPPHPNPPGERGGHSSPQQSWGVFWHIFIKLNDFMKVILFPFHLQIDCLSVNCSETEVIEQNVLRKIPNPRNTNAKSTAI